MFATRGRRGGTFVSDPQPPADPPSPEMLAQWRETCDQRLAVELGVAVLAAERAEQRRPRRARRASPRALEDALEDFAAYRQADIRLHVGLAEATRSARLVRAMTEVQGAMTDLIAYIAHPPEVLASSNAQHRRLLAAVRERDAMRAARAMTEHLQGTEHVLAGLLPGRLSDRRRAASAGLAALSACQCAEILARLPLTSVRDRAYCHDRRTDDQTFSPLGGEPMSTQPGP